MESIRNYSSWDRTTSSLATTQPSLKAPTFVTSREKVQFGYVQTGKGLARRKPLRPIWFPKAVIWRPLTARPGGGFSARQPNITDGLTSPTRAPPQRSRAACKRRRKACPSAATANSALVPWERERGREVGRLALLAVAAAVAVVAVLVACSSSALPHCAAEGARSCGHKNSGGRAARKHHRRYVVPPPLTPAHRHPSHGNGPS